MASRFMHLVYTLCTTIGAIVMPDVLESAKSKVKRESVIYRKKVSLPQHEAALYLRRSGVVLMPVLYRLEHEAERVL